MLREKKLKNIGLHPAPCRHGRKHPATALQSTLDTKSDFCYTPDKELEDGRIKLGLMIDEQEIADQVRKLTRLYHEKRYRINLFAMHAAFGVNKRVKYWAVPPGRNFPVNFEILKLDK
jgi:hypothetical protein